ncbi:MAG: radical SAM family heme chaperone HemW [Deltaproteobacteria bacterium]|jgi:oxygen-independent coproporphyrinogen-3 oxidase|nr:radical SAM family heme chaperone HemW [Deltaproteobacteria bacterium]
MPEAPGLYVHIPFCARKCPYCDFYSEKGAPEERDFFFRALERELEGELPFWREPFGSVFLGGGSPSVLSSGEAQRLEKILSRARVAKDAEFTLEANPGDLDRERLKLWRELGANRLSLGVQTFSPAGLKSLGRVHSPADAFKSARAAADLGFSLGVDLMVGWSGGKVEVLERDLETALSLGARHLSVYSLTLNPSGRFFRELSAGLRPALPGEEETAALLDRAASFLSDRGLVRYEVSNYAFPGSECRHNLKYWNRTPYLGLGPSAHAFTGKTRRANLAPLGLWGEAVLAGKPRLAFQEDLSPEDERLERLFLGLRLRAGLEESLAGDQSLVEGFVARGLLERREGRLLPTDAGFLAADYLARRLS